MYKNYAFNYYTQYIINQSKFDILKKYDFNINGCIHSCDWEVFCAILFNKKKLKCGFTDLEGYEIKSAYKGNSFEYQYHKNNGLQKLNNDRDANHVFVVYDNNYLNIDIYILNNDILGDILIKWGEEFIQNYTDNKQRFRKSLSYNFVINNSVQIMSIMNGKLQ